MTLRRSYVDGSIVELIEQERKIYYKAFGYASRELPPFKMCALKSAY